MAFTGHVLRGSSGKDALQTLEGKLEATTAQGRPRRMWLDDIKPWTQDIKRLHGSRSMSVESLHHGMSTL